VLNLIDSVLHCQCMHVACCQRGIRTVQRTRRLTQFAPWPRREAGVS
jgi:hypothetical protein